MLRKLLLSSGGCLSVTSTRHRRRGRPVMPTGAGGGRARARRVRVPSAVHQPSRPPPAVPPFCPLNDSPLASPMSGRFGIVYFCTRYSGGCKHDSLQRGANWALKESASHRPIVSTLFYIGTNCSATINWGETPALVFPCRFRVCETVTRILSAASKVTWTKACGLAEHMIGWLKVLSPAGRSNTGI